MTNLTIPEFSPSHPRVVNRLPRHFSCIQIQLDDQLLFLSNSGYQTILKRVLAHTQGRVFLTIQDLTTLILGCELATDLTFLTLLQDRIFLAPTD